VTPPITNHRWRALGEVYIAPPPSPTPRSFGFTVGGVLAAIALFSLWRGHVVRAEVAVAISGVLLVAGLVRPMSLAPLARQWNRFGHLLGWINSRVLLTAMFVLVVTPAGALGRLCGSDPLGRRGLGSRWLPFSPRARDPKHYERMF
jgi:Saxitoxin biosynthesis operon protein SxtJ